MMVKVGLKYCGGCQPTYDRVEFFKRLSKSVSGHVRFVPHDDPEAGHVLIITGCQSACVDLTPFEGKSIFLVSKEEDFETILEALHQFKGVHL